MRFRPLVCRGARILSQALLAIALVTLAVVGLGPHTGRYRTLTVLSGSMRPTIPPGSVVVVTPLPPSDIRPGDVITYRIPVDDRRVISHRVVEVVESGDHPVVRTRGDANAAPDPWLARLETEPAWRVRAAVPTLGFILHALRMFPLRPVLLWVSPALLLVVWLGRIHRRFGQDRAVLAFGLPDPGIVLVVPSAKAVRAPGDRAPCSREAEHGDEATQGCFDGSLGR